MNVIDGENTNLFGQFGFCVNINLFGQFGFGLNYKSVWSICIEYLCSLQMATCMAKGGRGESR